MDIFDVEGLLIFDTKGTILFKKIFKLNENILKNIIKKSLEEKDPIQLYEDKIFFLCKEGELCIVLISNNDSNEVFVGKCFEQFCIALSSILKKFTVEALWKKYDVVFLLADIFTYQGIIMENKHENMLGKLPKRSFEAIEGMKVPKGVASFINSATKSFGRYI